MLNTPDKQSNSWHLQDLTEIERQNLIGFFAVLEKIDQRLKREEERQND